MGFRFTLYSTWCVVSRAPRGPRERWLQVLDGMRRQRAAYVRVPTGSCELNFVGMPFMSGGKGMNHRIRRAERPKKQGTDKELFLVARVAIKYAGHSHFYRVISVASNALKQRCVGHLQSLSGGSKKRRG